MLGWGSLGYEQSVSPILMRVLVPIIPNEVCNQLYKSQITDHMLCAGYLWGGKDGKKFENMFFLFWETPEFMLKNVHIKCRQCQTVAII